VSKFDEAHAIVKEKYIFTEINNTFKLQLRLYEQMNFRIDEDNIEYKAILAKTTSKLNLLLSEKNEPNETEGSGSPLSPKKTIGKLFQTLRPRKKSNQQLFKEKEKEDSDVLSDNEDDTPIIANNFDELPPKYQKIVNKAKLPKQKLNQHFDILLGIIHFHCKREFKLSESKPNVYKSTSKLQIPRSHIIYRTADQIFSTGDAKTLYTNLQPVGHGGFGSVFSAHNVELGKMAVKQMAYLADKEKENTVAEISFFNIL